MNWDILWFVLGVGIAGLTLRDVFQTVIVPGEARSSLQVARRLINLLLPVWKLGRGRRRGLSGTFAPAILVNSFIVWMTLLMLGFGLMAYAERLDFTPPLKSMPEALYVVGSSLVTVGLSEESPVGGARWIILAAGFSGFAVVTMAVTYLLQVQSSITRRDTGIIKLNTVAGEPPCAMTLLERFDALKSRHELAETLRAARDWCATVRQSHVAHPTLIYFQSVGSEAGWPAALDAILDLSLIIECLLDDDQLQGPAILLRMEGTRTARELARSAGVDPIRGEPEELELRQAYAQLGVTSYRLCPAPDFATIATYRAEYHDCIKALATHLGKPSAVLVRQA